MTASSLPALPTDEIGPEETDVEFVHFECRTCGVRSEWMRDAGDSKHYDWLFGHQSAHGSFKYYAWSVRRNTGKTGLV